MKEGLSENAIIRIANALNSTINRFPTNQFRADALAGLDGLELKQRVNHVINVLHQHLPVDFEEAAFLLMSTKAVWNHGDKDDPLKGFAAWPLIDYIGVHGLAHPKLSLSALKHLTSLFSAEFAIRPFIIQHPKIAFHHLKQWCNDPDEHVRRLVSEGTRPRLPWGQQLPKFINDPTPLLPLLELLKDDDSEYVRRSVANSLNDISKNHPSIVIQTCQSWADDSNPKRAKLIRHATRTLVKSGHSDVFGLLGYTDAPQLSVQSLQVDRTHIELGETINFSILIKSTSAKQQRVVIDYTVHLMKANGKSTAKVFKLKPVTIEPGETIELHRPHSFKKITTRKYYTGQHAIELMINGVGYGRTEFELQVP